MPLPALTVGGDDLVTGSFFGGSNEGVGGVPKREDLSVWFGGTLVE